MRAHRQRWWPRRQHGAVLLLLVAVLGLGAASVLMNGVARIDLRAAPERKTELALKQARDALVGYAAANGRLPRPARETASGREFDGRCESDQQCSGFLPWVTLGIEPGDGWGRLLRYSVTPVMTSAPLQASRAVGTRTVLTRRSDGLAYLAGNPACALGAQCAAAVVLSGGRDGPGVTTLGLTQAGLPASAPARQDEQANLVADAAFMRRARSDGQGAGGAFDDQLVWITVDTVLNRMSRAGVLPRGD